MKKNFIGVVLFTLLGKTLLLFIIFLLSFKLKLKEAQIQENVKICDETYENYNLINKVYSQLKSSYKNISNPCEKVSIKEITVTNIILSYPILENKMNDYLDKEIYEVTFEDLHIEDGLVVYVEKDTFKVLGIRGGSD